jgi:hypothetical protein
VCEGPQCEGPAAKFAKSAYAENVVPSPGGVMSQGDASRSDHRVILSVPFFDSPPIRTKCAERRLISQKTAYKLRKAHGISRNRISLNCISRNGHSSPAIDSDPPRRPARSALNLRSLTELRSFTDSGFFVLRSLTSPKDYSFHERIHG